MKQSRDVNVCQSAGRTEPDGVWWLASNLRWVRTLSQPDAVVRVPQSTSTIARSFIARGARSARVMNRWKTFLSCVSHAASASR